MRLSRFSTPLELATIFVLAIVATLALGHFFDAIAVAHAAAAAKLTTMDLSHIEVMQCGPALDLISGAVTAAGANLTAWTMAAGDSAQIRNCADSKMIKLVSFWNDNQAAGQMRIKSPRLHDADRGITANIVASEVMPAMPFGSYQRLQTNDVLVLQQSGSAVAGDIDSGSLMLYYEDLGGVSANFIDYETLMRRIVNIKPVQNTVTATAGGTYSGAITLTATEDLMKADIDYALLGYEVSVECCTVSWRGSDTGNLRVGGPGNETQKQITGNWFIRQSRYLGKPCIPVINANNKNNTFVEVVQDENLTPVVVNSIFAELAPR